MNPPLRFLLASFLQLLPQKGAQNFPPDLGGSNNLLIWVFQTLFQGDLPEKVAVRLGKSNGDGYYFFNNHGYILLFYGHIYYFVHQNFQIEVGARLIYWFWKARINEGKRNKSPPREMNGLKIGIFR